MKAQITSLVLIFTILSSSVASATTLPGISTAIQEKLLVTVKNEVLPVFVAQLSKVSFPPISFSTGSWIFKEDYEISNVKLEKLDLTPSNTLLTLSSPSNVNIAVMNIDVDATFDYTTHGVFSEAGSGSFTLDGSGFSFTISLGSESGKPTVAVNHVGVTMGHMHVHFSSGWILKVAEFFANTFAALFKGIFEHIIGKTVTSDANSALAKVLATFPTNETIPHTSLAVDYALVGEPEATQGHIGLGVKGEIYDIKNPSVPVAPAVAMPEYDSTGLEFQAFISSFTINSLLYSVTESGVASVTIDQAMIPSKLPIKLNTNTFNAVFPGLTAKYGEDKACSLQISLADPSSKIEFTATDMVLSTDTHINIIVGSTVALQLVASTEFNATISVSGSKIYPNLTDAKVNTLTVMHSTIATFDVATATQNLNDLIGTAKILLDGVVFSQGLSLPTVHGIDLTDSTVTFKTGYVTIQSTPKFTGSLTEYFVKEEPEAKAEPIGF